MEIKSGLFKLPRSVRSCQQYELKFANVLPHVCGEHHYFRAQTFRAHSAPLFVKLGILDIFQVNSFQIAKFVFRYQNQLLPSMFLNLFLTSSQVHNYGTRAANHYRSHSCRTNRKQFTILYQGPKIWNSLPISITSSSSFFTFKAGVHVKAVLTSLNTAFLPISRSRFKQR